MNYNTELNENQVEVLRDIQDNGKERPWRDKKLYNTFLKESYVRIGNHKKALRVHECGHYLNFKVFEDGKMKLAGARFCQLRLCAMCNWRREMKIFSQLSKVVQKVEEKGYKFIFLTLTCENIDGGNLISSMNSLFSGFKRLFELKQVETISKGFFRALEITHDVESKITETMYRKSKSYYDSKFLKVGDLNLNFNKYHPHFHVMVVVNSSYFKKANLYIKQSKWVDLWQQSLRVHYTPIVDVRTVRNDNNSGVKEVAKYTVKDTDFIVKQDKSLTDETVNVLDEALAYRRLIAYGGIMKEIHRELNLQEDVMADVNISEDGEIINLPYILKSFQWHVGFKNYILKQVISD